MKIKIATRKSKLALWQTYHIQDLLQKHGLETQIITFDTKGDQILDRSLSKIGSKGVFTQELEAALLSGDVDIAVHSAKDMQSNLGEELEIIAFTKREVTNDVLAGFDKTNTINKEDIIIGTLLYQKSSFHKAFLPQSQGSRHARKPTNTLRKTKKRCLRCINASLCRSTSHGNE